MDEWVEAVRNMVKSFCAGMRPDGEGEEKRDSLAYSSFF